MDVQLLDGTSEQAEKLMAMSLVMGELYFSFRMTEDIVAQKDKEIQEANDSAKYWSDRFQLLAKCASEQAMKKFHKAVEGTGRV